MGHGPNFCFNYLKKLNQSFGHNVLKSRIVNTVTSFDAFTGQITEMS